MRRARVIESHLAAPAAPAPAPAASAAPPLAAVAPLPPSLTLGSKPVSSSSGKLGLLRASNDVLGDPRALRERLREDGYVYIRRLVPRGTVLRAQQAARAVMEKEGLWPHGKFSARWRECAEVMECIESPHLAALFRTLFGEEEVASLPFKWMRTQPPGGVTEFHMDNVYMNRGTSRLLTAWLPLQDVPYDMGGVCVVEKSHASAGFRRLRETYGAHDFQDFRGNYGNASRDPYEMLAFEPSARFLTSEFEAGDALVFSMFTVHGSVRNTSGRVRMSADVRWQPAADVYDERYVGSNAHIERSVGYNGKRDRGAQTIRQARKEWRLSDSVALF